MLSNLVLADFINTHRRERERGWGGGWGGGGVQDANKLNSTKVQTESHLLLLGSTSSNLVLVDFSQ